MIIGISIDHETCQILGQVSHDSLYWKENLLKDICGPGRDWRENSLHPGQIIYGQKSRKQWGRMPSWRKSKIGWMKSSIWKTHENCEGSISLTLRKCAQEVGNISRSCYMPCKIVKKTCWEWWIQQNWKQDLRVFWKLMNLQDCVWENHYQIVMKTILQEKETIHHSITIWFTNLFLSLKLWKFLQRKAAVDKKWEKLEKFSAWSPDKSQKWERGDRWSKDVGRKSVFCIIDGHMPFEKCWIGGKTPKI